MADVGTGTVLIETSVNSTLSGPTNDNPSESVPRSYLASPAGLVLTRSTSNEPLRRRPRFPDTPPSSSAVPGGERRAPFGAGLLTPPPARPQVSRIRPSQAGSDPTGRTSVRPTAGSGDPRPTVRAVAAARGPN